MAMVTLYVAHSTLHSDDNRQAKDHRVLLIEHKARLSYPETGNRDEDDAVSFVSSCFRNSRFASRELMSTSFVILAKKCTSESLHFGAVEQIGKSVL